jgi:uncharacterized membrane protein YbaN (DUF454 family)
MACIGMTAGFTLFMVGVHPSAWVAAVVATLMLASAVFVLSRPSQRQLPIKRTGDDWPCC